MPKEDLTSYLAHHGIRDNMSVYDDIYHYGVMGMKLGKHKKKQPPEQKKQTKKNPTNISRGKNFVTDRLAQVNNVRVKTIPNGIVKIKRSRNFVADRILDGKRLIIKKKKPSGGGSW